MNLDDSEIELLRQLRNSPAAPRVDVTQRVAETLRQLPLLRARAHRWTMTACAAVCAATAASIAVVSLLASPDVADVQSAVELVLDAHEIDVQSLLQ